ncbi:MAG: response regulator [Bacteroidota bacterium]
MPHKVLIVDDEPSIVLSLEFLMKQAGHEVTIARDGEAALEAVHSVYPDLVLLDVMLPRRSGFEVCQTVREHAEFANTKIILLTAKGRDVDVTKGLALGADDYVTKPFGTRELVQKVEVLLEGA